MSSSNSIPLPGKSLTPLQIRINEALQKARDAKASQSTAQKETIESAISKENAESATYDKSVLDIQQPANQSTGTDRFGNKITYNSAQAAAISLISSGKSCVVVGAAGTGKTTIQKGSTQALIQSGLLNRLNYSDHRYLQSSSYGIAICAYTRRATNNIRKNLSEDLQSSCITIHKLLEYEPTEIFVTDPETGNEKKSMRFLPRRNKNNPLPSSLTTIIIEEASMVSYELFQEILDACPHKPQFVFLGDIQQLPPVFGSAILGYKMLELPVVELTEVYRQALDSPIISLAHRILSGNPIKKSELASLHVPGKLTLFPWKKKISPEIATETLAKFFIKSLQDGRYNYETDGILIPFNKSCGTLELNRHLATQIARNEFRSVYEVIHGFKRSYYSVGDKCLYEREDAIIKSIYPNPSYGGVSPRTESIDMDYWGHVSSSDSTKKPGDLDEDDVDQLLQAVQVGDSEDGEGKKRAASHVIELQLLDSERTIEIKSSGELEALNLGYAITVHKSQGSEWRKVFLCFHQSHATMIQRELLYTAVTRAKEELFCICEDDTFEKGILRQRIPGDKWQDKAEHFRGKLDRKELQS